jgi:hypothetical protein
MTIHRTTRLAALSLAFAVALPVLADEVVTVDRSGTHHYVFYRDHDIYFAPDTRTYYWNENGTWRSGSSLPPEDQAFIANGGIDVQLDTLKPYERNDYVIQHYKDGPTTTRETTVSTSSDGSTTTTTTTTKRKYVYYADHDIFFAPDTKTYYWQSNGKWISGTTLPSEDQGFLRQPGTAIELDTDRPYERHDYVIAHYKNRQDSSPNDIH